MKPLAILCGLLLTPLVAVGWVAGVVYAALYCGYVHGTHFIEWIYVRTTVGKTSTLPKGE